MNSINDWKIEYNPYGFLDNDSWLESAYKTEDILQLVKSNGKFIIDVGFYDEKYVAVLVKNKDWDNPIEATRTGDVKLIDRIIQQWTDKY